jgi:putative ABC transport system ATP-binding protein
MSAGGLTDRDVPDGAVSVRCANLVHVYRSAGSHVAALRGIDLTVTQGETVALLGPSGAGKSTLLWHFAGLLGPTAGTVEVENHDLSTLTAPELASFRLREIGVLLQKGGRNLLAYLSAVDNVVHAQRPTRRTAKAKRERARALLDAVALGYASGRAAGRLSGGEQQRLGLAVALANGPRLLLADEPTSQLDEVAGAQIIELIKAANRDLGTTVIVVTHDEAVSAQLGRSVTIRDGLVGAETRFGEDFVVVGKDGALQIPPELLDALPPGTLARATRMADGISLQRLDHHESDQVPGERHES